MKPLSSSGNVKLKLTKAVFPLNVTLVEAGIFKLYICLCCLHNLLSHTPGKLSPSAFILVGLQTWNYPRSISLR